MGYVCIAAIIAVGIVVCLCPVTVLFWLLGLLVFVLFINGMGDISLWVFSVVCSLCLVCGLACGSCCS